MNRPHGSQSGPNKAVFLTLLMLLASWSVALAGVPLASAHEADDVVSWPLSGSNDTGWVQSMHWLVLTLFYRVKQRQTGCLNLHQVLRFQRIVPSSRERFGRTHDRPTPVRSK